MLFDRLSTQARPTLAVVTADHGEGLGDHGELTHGVFAYESVLKVPLIVSEIGAGARESTPTGVTVDTPARHVDLLPTLLQAVGAPADTTLPGSSLRDAIAGGNTADRPSYFESMTPTLARGWAPLRGVLVGREKLIDLPIAELYDLATDSGELRNLFSTRTDRAPVMLNVLKTFNVAPPGRPQKETPETLERLRSLGYIGGGSATAREEYTEADDPKRLIELEQTMTRAADAFRQGRPGEAIEMYKSVIAKRADTEDAYRKLALVYWRSGRAADAIATLETALRNGVTQSEVRIKLGQYLAESGQPGKAVALLGGDTGDDPDALIALGNAYQLAGQPAAAIKTFKRLLEIDPKNGLAWENIGTSQLQTGDVGAAEASLRRAIELDKSTRRSLHRSRCGTGGNEPQERGDRRVEERRRDRRDRAQRALQPDDQPRRRRPPRRGTDVWGEVHRRGATGVAGGCGGDKEGIGTVDSRQSLVVSHSPQSESSVRVVSSSRQSESTV